MVPECQVRDIPSSRSRLEHSGLRFRETLEDLDAHFEWDYLVFCSVDDKELGIFWEGNV